MEGRRGSGFTITNCSPVALVLLLVVGHWAAGAVQMQRRCPASSWTMQRCRWDPTEHGTHSSTSLLVRRCLELEPLKALLIVHAIPSTSSAQQLSMFGQLMDGCIRRPLTCRPRYLSWAAGFVEMGVDRSGHFGIDMKWKVLSLSHSLIREHSQPADGNGATCRPRIPFEREPNHISVTSGVRNSRCHRRRNARTERQGR